MSKRERQDTPDWQQEVPYKLCAQDDKDFQIKHKSSCLCGTVEYAVDSDPCAAKFCHCTGCQRLHGTSKIADVPSSLSRQAACLSAPPFSEHHLFLQVHLFSGQQCFIRRTCAFWRAWTVWVFWTLRTGAPNGNFLLKSVVPDATLPSPARDAICGWRSQLFLILKTGRYHQSFSQTAISSMLRGAWMSMMACQNGLVTKKTRTEWRKSKVTTMLADHCDCFTCKFSKSQWHIFVKAAWHTFLCPETHSVVHIKRSNKTKPNKPA